MSVVQEPEVKWTPEQMVEVTLNEPDDFLKVRETLTRIGVASRKEKKLYQSCHILHKQGRYYIVHFKELFALDGKHANLTLNDVQRRNRIARLLADWGLISVVKTESVADIMGEAYPEIVAHLPVITEVIKDEELRFHATIEQGMRILQRNIDKKVDMSLNSDTAQAITNSMGKGMIGFSDALKKLNPDLLLVLGDRFEIFSATASAMIKRIPIAHIHGGEATEGLIDESIRHCITKMSHIHFVAANEYRNRVIQLGESPDCVHLVGGLGVDSILKIELMEKKEKILG